MLAFTTVPLWKHLFVLYGVAILLSHTLFIFATWLCLCVLFGVNAQGGGSDSLNTTFFLIPKFSVFCFSFFKRAVNERTLRE